MFFNNLLQSEGNTSRILRKSISKNEKSIVILEMYTGKMVKDTQETANIPVSCPGTTKPSSRNITTEALYGHNQINAKTTRTDVADQDILLEFCWLIFTEHQSTNIQLKKL